MCGNRLLFGQSTGSSYSKRLCSTTNNNKVKISTWNSIQVFCTPQECLEDWYFYQKVSTQMFETPAPAAHFAKAHHTQNWCKSPNQNYLNHPSNNVLKKPSIITSTAVWAGLLKPDLQHTSFEESESIDTTTVIDLAIRLTRKFTIDPGPATTRR